MWRMGCDVGAALVIGFATEWPRLVTCIRKLYWMKDSELGMGMITVRSDVIGPCLTPHNQPAIPTYGLTRFSSSKRAEKKKLWICTNQFMFLQSLDKAWDFRKDQGTGWYLSLKVYWRLQDGEHDHYSASRMLSWCCLITKQKEEESVFPKGPFDRLVAPGKIHHSGIRTCSDLVARRISVLVHTHVKLCMYYTYGLEGI